MKKFILMSLLLAASLAFGQGAQRLGQATTNANGYVKVLSGATISVCSYPSCGATSLFQDVGLSIPQTNPLFADGNGNYSYYVTPGTYFETVSSPGAVTRVQVVTLQTGTGVDLASPPPIGNTTPNTGAFTTLTASSVDSSGGYKVGGVTIVDSSRNATFVSSTAGDFVSSSANPASAGAVRLANSNCLDWRNNANSANLGLCVNIGDQVTFNSSILGLALPTYYAVQYGVVGNDSTDDYTALVALMTAVSAAGGGKIQLPVTNSYTKLGTDPTIPTGVIIRGCGRAGNQLGTYHIPACGLDFHATGGTAHANLTNAGIAGFEDIDLKDAVGSETFIYDTLAVPYINHVSFQGSASGASAVNTAIQLGSTNGGVYGCGVGSTNFCGYGVPYINDTYYHKISTALYLGDDANGVRFDNADVDATSGNGYAVVLAGHSGHPTVDNVIGPTVEVEITNYTGALDLKTYAQGNYIWITAADPSGQTTYGIIEDANSFTNNITCIGPQFDANAVCINDVNGAGSHANTINDLSHWVEHTRTLDVGAVGLVSNPPTINAALLISLAGPVTFSGTGACATRSGASGGLFAGQVTCTGTTGASTLTITSGKTAPHGWACYASDVTNTLSGSQSTASTTAPVMTFSSVSTNDLITFGCLEY